MELFINNLILLSVTSSIFIVLTHLVYSLSKDRYTAKWKYYIWLILAIRLLIPLDISIKSLSLNVPTFQGSISKDEVSINENLSNESLNHPLGNLTSMPDSNLKNTSNQTFENTTHKEEISKTEKTKVVKTLTPHQIAFIIWLSGILAFMGIDIIKYCIFKRKLTRWSLSIKNGQYNEVLSDSLNKMKINNTVNLYVSKAVYTPMLAGIIKPSIYIPHENYSLEELEIIIKHELIHYKRHDLLYKLLLMLVKDVHWFNPFVHFMAVEANKDLELICDEEVVKNKDFEYRERYSKLLLDSASAAKSQVHLATGIFGGVKTIKRRFVNILNVRQYKKGYKFTAGIALLLIISNLFVSCGEKVGISPQP
ncbi:M56 family metallopeptidase [Acetivibrio clariflavus]|uniref:Antirepressor regulating drug resistance protein n=2 Tax=Acetivibrio clariflavus TaxID=288965 RepID=G8LXZ8_ACECE|nr:antirepressor regulating drug resistance protein [Acetivibrio clariflavus]AEV69930.1 antirepressor regulating drug resistance protein [Acetivibrio clariflavus DSM 19732]